MSLSTNGKMFGMFHQIDPTAVECPLPSLLYVPAPLQATCLPRTRTGLAVLASGRANLPPPARGLQAAQRTQQGKGKESDTGSSYETSTNTGVIHISSPLLQGSVPRWSNISFFYFFMSASLREFRFFRQLLSMAAHCPLHVEVYLSRCAEGAV